MKVYLDTVGCRLNQSEIEHMAAQFRQAGHELVGRPEDSDLMVVNTCTVTAAADADSRAKVRRLHRARPEAAIAVTGCWSSLHPDQAGALPGVRWVVPNEEKDALVARVLGLPLETFDREPLERRPIPGLRRRTRAFVKAQDGCDYRCTFCLTTIARGASRSLPVERVVAEVRAAVAGGAQEVVLTGVALSSYGRDLPDRPTLSTLVRAVLGETEVRRLRLSSLEPWGLPADFFDLWQDRRLCRHLHLPLQSGCAATLRRMGRPMRPAAYARLVERARAAIPDLALTTDVIVGFPGETEAEFRESLAFIRQMAFADAHVFTYSPRPGTPASRLPDPVHPAVARARNRIVRQTVAESAAAFRRRFLGQEAEVLWETMIELTPEGWRLSGWTDTYLRVQALGDPTWWNQVARVRLARLEGEIFDAGRLPARGEPL